MPADTIVILLVWLFYALECLAWDRKGVIYFRTLAGKRWRIVRPSRLLENGVSGLAVLFPFPPLGIQSPAHPPPIAFSPEGLSVYVPESGDPPCGGGTDHYLYEEIVDLRTSGHDILINKRPFVRAPSKRIAAELGELITKLKERRVEERGELIEGQITGLFDRSRIVAAVNCFREKTSLVLLLGNILWLYLIVGLPAVIYIYGFSRIVLPVLALVLLLHLVITGMSFRVHRAIYGERDYSLLYALLPSPFHSIRATDLLARKLMSGFHPFAVACSLLPRERFLAYARASLARIRHVSYDARMSVQAREIDQSYKRGIVRSMDDALRTLDIDVESLRFPEFEGKGTGHASYCPRCHGLYQIKEGVCADCPDMPLVPVPGGGKELLP